MRRKLTWVEQLLEEGEEGLAKALEKGIEMGTLAGVEIGREQFRQALLRQLGMRFGPLSDDVKRQVEEIRSTERLNQIADQVLVARSLEEMGLR